LTEVVTDGRELRLGVVTAKALVVVTMVGIADKVVAGVRIMAEVVVPVDTDAEVRTTGVVTLRAEVVADPPPVTVRAPTFRPMSSQLELYSARGHDHVRIQRKRINALVRSACTFSMVDRLSST
jgi:hypothetical protein